MCLEHFHSWGVCLSTEKGSLVKMTKGDNFHEDVACIKCTNFMHQDMVPASCHVFICKYLPVLFDLFICTYEKIITQVPYEYFVFDSRVLYITYCKILDPKQITLYYSELV